MEPVSGLNELNLLTPHRKIQIFFSHWSLLVNYNIQPAYIVWVDLWRDGLQRRRKMFLIRGAGLLNVFANVRAKPALTRGVWGHVPPENF